MPLPLAGQPWPPPQLAPISEAMRAWDAWYTGDPQLLREAYARDLARPADRPSQHRGGLVGAVARWWWGRPARDEAAQRGQLHIPLAADICQASADLLFAEPPTLTAPDLDDKVQQRLDDLVGDGLFATAAEGAEIGAALGGTYLRTTWDPAVADAPFWTSVDADAVIPDWRWGRLVAATIWRRVRTDGQTVWRHLERHETTSDGTGIVLHALYQGAPDNLGRVVPLTEADATGALADVVDEQSMVSTASPGLALTYIPNQRPQRRWRTHPVGAPLGRSDLDGVESLMDSLDETWSSWMRDIRLAKARLIVPEYMLTSHAPGQGASFDTDAEVWSPLPGAAPTEGGQQITPVQFAIRVADHQGTCDQLIDQILRTAGYSASTFGRDSAEGAAMTATEVNARSQRTDLTRDRKVRHWRPGLAQAVAKLLAVDAALFGGPATGITPADIAVDFGDSVQDSPLELAQTAQAMRAAQAASTKTLVQVLHPDWDDDAINSEVQMIHSESSVPDPAVFHPIDSEAQESPSGVPTPEGQPTT